MSWEFAQEHEALVIHYAKRFHWRHGYNPRLEVGELAQEGLLVLHGMADEYDETKGKVSTFCTHKIYRSFDKLANCYLFAVSWNPDIRYCLSDNMRPYFEQATQKPHRYEKDHDPFVMSAVEGDIDLDDAKDWIKKSMRRLPKKQRAQLIQRFGLNGCSEHRIVDMAKQRGLTEKAMGSRLRRTINSLLDEMLDTAWVWGAGRARD